MDSSTYKAHNTHLDLRSAANDLQSPNFNGVARPSDSQDALQKSSFIL